MPSPKSAGYCSRGARGLGATGAVQAQVSHEPHGRYNGLRDRHRDARRPQDNPASRASRCSRTEQLFSWTRLISVLRASSRRLLALWA